MHGNDPGIVKQPVEIHEILLLNAKTNMQFGSAELTYPHAWYAQRALRYRLWAHRYGPHTFKSGTPVLN